MTRKLLGIALLSLLATACQQPDTAVTAVVKANLIADEKVGALDIDVKTEKGVVTLTGTSADPEVKDQALEIARQTPGVKSVVDMISVRRSDGTGDAPSADRTLGESLDDAGITAAVKSRLLADPVVKGLAIDVDTRQGVVFLTGTVNTAEEKDHAVELARGTRHVKDVRADLTVEQG